MGLLKSFTPKTAGTTSTDVRVDRDCHTILVRRQSDKPLGLSLRKSAPELVTATIRDHSGNVNDIIKNGVTLGDLAAFAQYGGVGLLDLTTDSESLSAVLDYVDIAEGLAKPAAGKYLAYLPIALTIDGVCVKTNGEEDFIINFAGLDAEGIYDFIAIEGEVSGTNMLHYQSLNILQDQHERTLDVDSMVSLVAPATTVLQRLMLTYANGESRKFNMAEIKFLAAQHNPSQVNQVSFTGATCNASSLPAALAETIALPLHSVVKMEIDTDGSAIRFVTVYNRSRLATY